MVIEDYNTYEKLEDPDPVKEKFHNQLTMREKPKFSRQNDLEVYEEKFRIKYCSTTTH